jgi:hypothetical protein
MAVPVEDIKTILDRLKRLSKQSRPIMEESDRLSDCMNSLYPFLPKNQKGSRRSQVQSLPC